MLKRKDAMVSGHRVPLEESSEWAQSDARAEQICFVKEALGLAAEGLSEGQASVFWPVLAGSTLEECGVRHGIPRQWQPLARIAIGPPCAAPARPKAGTRDRTGTKRMIGWSII